VPTVAPKAAKGSKGETEAILDLPEGFSWDEAKDYNYRQLQGICKILRSQGKYDGNLAGKGVNKEHLKNAVANYFRSLGVDVVEVKVSKTSEMKPLALPHLAAARADQAKRASKVAVAA
jgi:hypothetical protein